MKKLTFAILLLITAISFSSCTGKTETQPSSQNDTDTLSDISTSAEDANSDDTASDVNLTDENPVVTDVEDDINKKLQDILPHKLEKYRTDPASEFIFCIDGSFEDENGDIYYAVIWQSMVPGNDPETISLIAVSEDLSKCHILKTADGKYVIENDTDIFTSEVLPDE